MPTVHGLCVQHGHFTLNNFEYLELRRQSGADIRITIGAGAEIRNTIGAGAEIRNTIRAGTEIRITIGAGAEIEQIRLRNTGYI